MSAVADTHLRNIPPEQKQQASARDTTPSTRRRSKTHASAANPPSQEKHQSKSTRSPGSYELSLEVNAADTETTTSPTTRRTRKYQLLRSSDSSVKSKSSPLTTPLRQARSEIGRVARSPSSRFSPSDNQTSYFALKSPSTSALRSPTVRKPPASRSANGVETTSGPPPAISTQRAFSFELQNIAIERRTSEQAKLTSDTLDRLDFLNRIAQDSGQVQSTNQSQASSGQTLREKSPEKSSESVEQTLHSATSEIMEQRNHRYSLEGSRLARHRLSAQANTFNQTRQDVMSNGSSNDDLFLNMAQTADGDDVAEQEPKSGNAVPSRRLSLMEGRSMNRYARAPEDESNSSRTNAQYTFQTPPSDLAIARDRVHPATTHPLESRYVPRLSHLSPTAGRIEAPRDSPGFRKSTAPTSYHSRFRSTHLPDTTTYTPSPITARHQSFEHESSSSSPPPTNVAQRVAGGTESTVSTTAPSTVWDELDGLMDGLKSRIRKLEAAGKQPPSSSGSAERPRTAATSATTMSSSSKQNGTKDNSPTNPGGFDDVSPHPLLNSALEKARAALSPEAYQALEKAAAEALNLVKMTASSNTPTALERQLKRPADNMCRSLMELCVALSASKIQPRDRSANRARSTSRGPPAPREFPIQQPQSASQFVEQGQFERAQSMNPEPTAGQRALSRLEARRTSMKLDASKVGSNQYPPQTTQNFETNTPTQSTISRTNTVLQRTRQLGDGINPEDIGFTFRPLSRATTELARANTTSGTDRQQRRISREYTSNYAPPSPFARNAQGTSNTASRRSYLSSSATNTNSSTTSTIGPLPTQDRDRDTNSTAPSSFPSRHLHTRTGTITGSNTAEDPSLRAATDSPYRTPYSGSYSAARSLLGRRAGDRRSFAEPSDEIVSAGQF